MCMPPNNYNNYGCGNNNWGNNINPADLDGNGHVNPFEQYLHDNFGYSNPNANQGGGNGWGNGWGNGGGGWGNGWGGPSASQVHHNNIGQYERWWDGNKTLQSSEAKKLIKNEFHSQASGGDDNNYVGNNNNIIGDTYAERQHLANKYGIYVGSNGVTESQLNQMLRNKYNNY